LTALTFGYRQLPDINVWPTRFLIRGETRQWWTRVACCAEISRHRDTKRHRRRTGRLGQDKHGRHRQQQREWLNMSHR
jgi:hypothetical protein